MWVKICGITNREDALAAVEAGADALGFIFVPTSPRAITRQRAEEILRALPATVLTVAVVADESREFLRGLLRVCPFGGLQFHGDEPPEEVLALKGQARLIKAIRVRDAESLKAIPRYHGVDQILLDARRGHELVRVPGSSGEGEEAGARFDWRLAAGARAHGIPLIAAGGLTPAGVADCIRAARPFGVDAASGVEISPGRKDPAKVRDFVLRAKEVT